MSAVAHDSLLCCSCFSHVPAGEVFAALRASGALHHILRSGVRCLDVHTVEDNLLAKVADPVYLGYCHSVNLDCAAKVGGGDGRGGGDKCDHVV